MADSDRQKKLAEYQRLAIADFADHTAINASLNACFVWTKCVGKILRNKEHSAECLASKVSLAQIRQRMKDAKAAITPPITEAEDASIDKVVMAAIDASNVPESARIK